MADKKQLIYKEDLLETVLNHFGCDLAYYGKDLQFCQEAIDMAPAVDAVEVVHGRWEQARYTEAPLYICSKCDKPEYKQHNYCPQCGAKMDGDSANG